MQNGIEKKMEIDVTQNIRKVSIKAYNAEKFKSGLKLIGDDQSELASVEFFQGMWETIEIPLGYEIIGLYGTTSQEFLTNIGFVIW